MRPTLLIGLLNNLAQNIAKHKIENMAIFEEGVVFSFGQKQEQMISGVMIGNAILDDHFKECRKYDLFDAKAIIDDLVQGTIKKETINFAHTYKCFGVWQNDVQVARYGEIHPKIAKDFDLQQTIVFFEIFVEKIAVKNIIKNDYSLHPIIKDMAFIVHSDILVGDMIDQIGDIVDNIIVCDVYQGDGIEAKHKSVMFRMTINPETELSSEDINVIMINISQILDSKFGAKLRGEL
jgi:phenylalanyl-tRNA synthetase beta chain